MRLWHDDAGGAVPGADMNDLERKVVDLIDEGYVRWKIAEVLGLGESTVRGVIRRLCERHGCSMRELPEATKGERE